MDLRSLLRPAAQLLTSTRSALTAASITSSSSSTITTTSLLPLTSIRGHKTTARTKRALKIAPHDSFLPSRSEGDVFPTANSIIYNPPASEASPSHTPFLFLPRNDPRRLALLRIRSTTSPAAAVAAAALPAGMIPSSAPASEEDLPPEMRYKRREPRYNLGKEQILEMRRLRNEDPLTWSVQRLARKFDCSTVFVQIAAPAPEEHLKWLRGKLERKMARWGPKRTQAREDRKTRAEMLYRGEL